MANWSSPVLTDLYTNVMSYLKGRDDDAIRLNDTRSASASNLPDNAKRWNETLGTFQNWLSSVWSNIVIAIAGGGTGATTASGARSNLSVPSVAEAQATAQGLVDTHNAVTSPHGAVSAATANKLIVRDAWGNARVAAPQASDDIATAQYAIAAADGKVANHQALYDAHGAVSTPTASRLVLRDSVGRAQVASPSVSGDIATKGYVDGRATYQKYDSGWFAVALNQTYNKVHGLGALPDYVIVQAADSINPTTVYLPNTQESDGSVGRGHSLDFNSTSLNVHINGSNYRYGIASVKNWAYVRTIAIKFG